MFPAFSHRILTPFQSVLTPRFLCSRQAVSIDSSNVAWSRDKYSFEKVYEDGQTTLAWWWKKYGSTVAWWWEKIMRNIMVILHMV